MQILLNHAVGVLNVEPISTGLRIRARKSLCLNCVDNRPQEWIKPTKRDVIDEI